MAPFLADKTLIQQGYLGSEPFLIEQATGIKPVVLLVADGGYNGYSNIITTSRKLIEEKPDVVRRFVDASIEGWYSFLYHDPTPANLAIKKANPEMTDALLAYGRKAMLDHGIVNSGDALKLGHWRDDRSAVAGILPRHGCRRRLSCRHRRRPGLHNPVRRSRVPELK